MMHQHTKARAMIRELMNWTLGLLAIAMATVVLSAWTNSVHADELRYRIVDLGPLPDGIGTSANAVNERGEVIGVSYVNFNGNIANARPVVWRDGQPELLWSGPETACYFCDPPIISEAPYDGGIPLAVNDYGAVVGRMQNSPYTGTALPRRGIPDGQGFVWTPADGLLFVPNLFGGLRSEVTGVNIAGLIVGSAEDRDQRPHAFSLDAVGNFRELDTLPGGEWVRATGVNDHGQIVGYADVGEGHERAFLFDPNMGMIDMGSLGASSRGMGINDNGIVVGYSWRVSAPTHAFVWNRDDGMTGTRMSLG